MSVERTRRPATSRAISLALAIAALTSALVVGSTLAPAPTADAAPAGATALHPVTPCRLLDTRTGGGRIAQGGSVVIQVAGRCGVPADAQAVALSMVVTGATQAGYATAYPAGGQRPTASNINFRPQMTVANSAVVPLGGGRVRVYLHGSAHLVVDVTAAFRPVDAAVGAGRYVPAAPRRLLDTRTTGQRGTGTLRLPLPSGVPSDAMSLAVNVTIVNAASRGYVGVRPAGTPRQQTSIQNADDFNRTRAVTVIASVTPAGLEIYRHMTTDVVVDLAGWFTGPSSAASEDGLFVPRAPTRIYDSRQTNVPLHRRGTVEVPVDGLAASAVLANVTAVQAAAPGYMSVHAAGTPRNGASLQNPRWRIPAANSAIIGLSARGVSLYGHVGMHVLVDLMGHFTGPRVAGNGGTPANQMPTTGGRVLMVSDSAFAGIRWSGNLGWLRGAEFRADLESCRRLIGVSCRGREGYAPTTGIDAILRAPGQYDTLVVTAGYNDYASQFDDAVAGVLAAARARGIPRIVWLTYRQNVSYRSPYGASNAATFRANNAYLRAIVASGRAPEIEIADWNAYSANAPSSWFASDRLHLTATGAQRAASYVSQKLAFLERRACPTGVGSAAPGGWCADPD